MNVIRCIYTRGDKVKYISHLDLLRVFERALRRAELPVQFSEGYNPRPKIVFALPLPVGVTSEGEYADITFCSQIPADDFMQQINKELPDGIRIIDAWEHQPKSNVMAEVENAIYELTASYDGTHENAEETYEDAKEIIDGIMMKSKLTVEKKTDKGAKDIDIRPMIKDMTIVEQDSDECNKINNGNNVLMLKIAVKVSAGSRENLRPDLVANALGIASEGRMQVQRIHRVRLLLTE
ncbi:MAG: TIGR03936 family radical SAM-associated protein [Eubacteriales bacterium]|nr:TIGR03936 family radical SAM-associated protein [Eubacteriales bacterium]